MRNKSFITWVQLVRTAPRIFKDWFKKENLAIKKIVKNDFVVLDIGCGDGHNMATIARKSKLIVCLDFDKTAIKEAKKFLSKFKNVRFVNKDILKYKELKTEFDAVIITGNTFGNFRNNKQAVLKVISKLLKPKGLLLISVYSEKSLPYKVSFYRRFLGDPNRIDNDIVYYKKGIFSEHFSRQRLSNILKDAGYKSKITRLNKIAYLAVAHKK